MIRAPLLSAALLVSMSSGAALAQAPAPGAPIVRQTPPSTAPSAPAATPPVAGAATPPPVVAAPATTPQAPARPAPTAPAPTPPAAQQSTRAPWLFLTSGANATPGAGAATTAPAAPAAPKVIGTILSPVPLQDTRLGISQIQAVAPSTVLKLLSDQRTRWEKPPEGVPLLNAVIWWNNGPDIARFEADWRAGVPLGPVTGVPFMVKDNIDAESRITTAGSLALRLNGAERDASVVRRLREAGGWLYGKTNLSEWANFRGDNSASGWSAAGGLTRNPFALDRSVCGSSSGSAAAVAAGLVPVAIGTETDGSIVCPASVTGIVGLKPTVGLVSRVGIVPLSVSQDTPGPMTLNVEDAARVLSVIAGSDPDDPSTAEADRRKRDYFAGLDPNALKGVKLAVMRWHTGHSYGTDAVFEEALDILRAAGADIVDAPTIDEAPVRAAERIVLETEFKAGINSYLATTSPTAVPTRTLADLIAFNRANARTELRWFGQEVFERAQATRGLGDPAYVKAKADAKRLAGAEGIDRVLKATGAVALIAPTSGPAWTIDLVNGDNFGGSPSTLPAVAGYPHLTVPMGRVEGLPVGLSFIGPAWSDQTLLSLGYSFQEARK